MDRESLVKTADIPSLANHLKAVDGLLLDEAKKGGQLSPILTDSLKRPAKRLRPILLILSAQISDKPVDKEVIRIAAAIEAVHQASLTHDWIMDGQAGDISNSDLLLAGDFLLATGLALAAEVSGQAAQCLAAAVSKMAAGQKKQLSRDYRPDSISQSYIETVSLKTAALFAAATQIGSLLSEKGILYSQPLSQYGLFFGIEFQIIDDLVDGDFEHQKQAATWRVAGQYAQQARDQIAKLPTSPASQALAKLPAAYLAAQRR